MRKAFKTDLTQEILKAILDYDPETGVFTWKVGGGGRRIAGAAAGYHRTNGRPYLEIGINRKVYLGHRLAWLYHYGELPTIRIDHIDHDPSNNRISNLRLSSQAENTWNSLTPCNNTSGVKGVAWDESRGQWIAYVAKNYRRVFQKRFDTKEEAILAVRVARELLHGEFCHHG